MTGKRFFLSACVLALAAAFGLLPGCSSDDPASGPIYLEATLSGQDLRHGLYFTIDYRDRFIRIDFNMPLRTDTVPGNIGLSDKAGSLAAQYDLQVDGYTVFLNFHNGFELQPGWKYLVTVSDRIRSTLGYPPEGAQKLEIRTSSRHIFALAGNAMPQQDTIVCFSDVHMGEKRAVDNGYSWFSTNSDALLSFVQDIQASDKVKQAVILGDLFDEWLVPYATKPFDNGVTDDEDYFNSVRNAPKNSPAMDVLAQISGAGLIDVIYVHGNHDMKLESAVLKAMLPDVEFMGDPAGLGIYEPMDRVVMEHGHRYDFFNSPQPLANPPHILPPGYFVSRLWAAGMEAEFQAGGPFPAEEDEGPYGDVEITFPAAWVLALAYSQHHFPDLPLAPLDQPVVLMSGIDGYANPFSFDGALMTYVNGNIETLWPNTQAGNDVLVENSVFGAILNGHSNLFGAAKAQYLNNPGAAQPKDIVVFGHTHEPMLQVYPPGKDHTGIYANTGSWVNQNVNGYIGGTPDKVRTFVAYAPAQWTGSDLDTVTLYQYNPKADGTGFEAIVLAEESLDRGK